MIISHKYKFIFIKTTKTAGTSIEVFLSQFCDKNDILTPINPQDNKTYSKHQPRNYSGYFNPLPELLNSEIQDCKRVIRQLAKKRKYHEHIGAKSIRYRCGKNVWNSYFKFCFERNPWDKSVSAYCYRQSHPDFQEQRSFNDFVNSRKDLPSNYNLYTIDGEIAVDFIGKYESLNEDFLKICQIINLPDTGEFLPQANKSLHRHQKRYQNLYDSETKRKVASAFAREISLLNYQF